MNIRNYLNWLAAPFLCCALGCGSDCNSVSRLFGEASCRTLNLDATIKPIAPLATCVGTPSSRKVAISCGAASGTKAQCTSISDGLSVYIVLVPNNTAGTFTDSTGVNYSSCGALLQDLGNSLVKNVLAFYVSDPAAAGNRLNCSDAAGCVLPLSTSCLSGWDSTLNPPGPSGTASLPNGTQVLACVYIDTSGLNPPPPAIAVGPWNNSPLTAITIGGNLNFNSGWVDAF